ncbi:hypothetical protein HN865_02310 [Candidatus Woesearchaeota archaeon]|jgi:hypothetical protein|nr:hypothetical protein [Candidatus Woesearchaeota archaeon]MBT7237667.1 hypothetical protein [Candidatus Woesearchaeota archaeon]
MTQPIPQQPMYSNQDELNTRIRILEGKYNLTRERMLLINQNMIDHYKTLNEEIRTVKKDLKEIKEIMETIKETNASMIKEMSFFARKDQLKVLEKYINMWNPLNFITKEEVLELINKKGDKHASRNKR